MYEDENKTFAEVAFPRETRQWKTLAMHVLVSRNTYTQTNNRQESQFENDSFWSEQKRSKKGQ